jgi:hypothetical protein
MFLLQQVDVIQLRRNEFINNKIKRKRKETEDYRVSKMENRIKTVAKGKKAE